MSKGGLKPSVITCAAAQTLCTSVVVVVVIIGFFFNPFLSSQAFPDLDFLPSG